MLGDIQDKTSINNTSYWFPSNSKTNSYPIVLMPEPVEQVKSEAVEAAKAAEEQLNDVIGKLNVGVNQVGDKIKQT